MAEHVLVAEGLGKRFRRRGRTTWALRGCDLALPAGRITALVGPNGAGKSTLLRLATGLLRPTEGRIVVTGADPARGMPPEAGYLAQHKPLYRGFSVHETLRAGAALNQGGRWDAPYVARLVAEAEIEPHERTDDLSAGQRARVALALALGRRPSLLLLDEPLAELDPLARRQVMGTLLAEAGESGMSVLMASHVLPELEDACDHLVLLRDEKVCLAGELPDLLDEHRVVVGRAEDVAPEGAVHVSTAGRQSTALVRGSTATGTAPSLDDLVLAYLQERAR